jgi:hypothetical protein
VNRTVEMAVRAAGAAGEVVVRKAAQMLHTVGAESHGGGAEDPTQNRWRVVTINKSPMEVAPDGRLPEPLAAMGDEIEVQIRPAPGDKGTELAARLTHPEPSGAEGAAARAAGTDPRQKLRTALRDAKMLIETGEILQPDRPGSTHPSPLGLPVRMAVKRARGEGLL